MYKDNKIMLHVGISFGEKYQKVIFLAKNVRV